MTITSRNRTALAVSASVVYLMAGFELLMSLKNSRKLSNPRHQIANVSCTYHSHSDGYYSAVLNTRFSKCPVITGNRELPIAMLSFLWKNLSVGSL
jgi:hypothetical protein